jgi:membrane protein DedA with SNARE-associated domain
MPDLHFTALLSLAGHSDIGLLAVILLASLLLEDAATIGTGLLAAAGAVDPLAAVLTLTFGTAAGDIALHAVGRWLGSYRWVVARRNEPRFARAVEWIGRRSWFALASARFLPGFRLPTYLASGVLKLPVGRCAAAIVAASVIWTPALFYLSCTQGVAITEQLVAQWLFSAPIALLCILGLTVASRRFADQYPPNRDTRRQAD